MNRPPFPLFLLMICSLWTACSHSHEAVVPASKMQEIYEEVKTPYKYGLIMVPPADSLKMDCPSVFRKGGMWYMTCLVFDGRGYETWLAGSRDLLHWDTMGAILSFSDSAAWDDDQKAGYIALQDHTWGGSYRLGTFDGKYWLSYFGGSSKGYEAGLLSISMAFTTGDPAAVHDWARLGSPVLMSTDEDVRWWENSTLYKSTVIRDKKKITGYPFVMYYNARGDSLNPDRGAERIGMAVSHDMVRWDRYLEDPVLDHHEGITGDPYIQKIDDVWIMFYFGAFWKGKPPAFNRFACSWDLVNWTDWGGPDLIAPSEPYDEVFAHKSFVVKYKGIVYHFYCAVNKRQQRGIALAASEDLGKSGINFILDE
jgi:predicted GH43/DUF377 family glycosyl hydrolase